MESPIPANPLGFELDEHKANLLALNAAELARKRESDPKNWKGVPMYLGRDLAPGAIRLVEGLKSKPELNGRLAVLRKFIPEKERWEARVLGTDEFAWLKADKLQSTSHDRITALCTLNVQIAVAASKAAESTLVFGAKLSDQPSAGEPLSTRTTARAHSMSQRAVSEMQAMYHAISDSACFGMVPGFPPSPEAPFHFPFFLKIFHG
jgi:hypothetical protein